MVLVQNCVQFDITHFPCNGHTRLYLFQAGRTGDRILVGARFSAPIQTGPGVHPASYTRDTESLSMVEKGRCMALSTLSF